MKQISIRYYSDYSCVHIYTQVLSNSNRLGVDSRSTVLRFMSSLNGKGCYDKWTMSDVGREGESTCACHMYTTLISGGFLCVLIFPHVIYLCKYLQTRLGLENHNTGAKYCTWTQHVWIPLPMHLSHCLEKMV